VDLPPLDESHTTERLLLQARASMRRFDQQVRLSRQLGKWVRRQLLALRRPGRPRPRIRRR